MNTSADMEETLELREVMAILRRRKRFIATVFTSIMLAALLFLLLVTPEYTSEATLKYNPSRFEISKEKSQMGSDLFDRLIAGEIAAVNSPAVLLKAIKSENLLIDPELNKTTLRDVIADALEMFQAASAKRDHELEIMERFKKKLGVDHPERTNLISIAYTSEDPEKSARIANAVANIFLAQHLEDRLSATPLAAKWLNDRKITLRDKWRESQGRFEKYKAEHNLSYVSGEKLREQHVDRLNEQLVLAGTKTEAARARVEQVRLLLKTRNYQQLANSERSEVLTRLRDRFAAASQREASLSSTLLPGHPSLREAKAEITSLRIQIENEGKRILDNLEVKFKAARGREALIRSNFDKTIQGMQDSGSALVRLRELERTAATDREIYEAFLNRSNETLEQSTGQFANFRLIKVAQVPIKPSFPAKFKVLALAAIAAFAAGVGLAFLLEALRDTFRTRAQATEALRLPVIASLPALTREDLDGAELRRVPERTVALTQGSPFVAGVSALYRALDATDANDSHSKMIAVTSAGEREGKTMVAASLAQKAALSGSKVLLIDGNWRTPVLHRIFGSAARTANRQNGNGQSTDDPLLLHDDVTGLDVLPAMAGTGHTAGFAESEAFNDMLQSASDNYDLVVIDAGAVLSNPDSWTICEVADEAVFVVQCDKTRRGSALQALRTLESCNANTIGMVLNGVSADQFSHEKDSVPPVTLRSPGPGRRPASGRGQETAEQPASYPLG